MLSVKINHLLQLPVGSLGNYLKSNKLFFFFWGGGGGVRERE